MSEKVVAKLPMHRADYWNFENAVAGLPANVKQAFYKAGLKKEIKQGTWDGCAFNAGGSVIGRRVQSIEDAARAFNCRVSAVTRFIRIWDNLGTKVVANVSISPHQQLMAALNQVGLDTPPTTIVPQVAVGIDRKLIDEFRKQLESDEFFQDVEDAGVLLFS